MMVLILGSGRVGTAIARELVSLGHHVTVLDRDPEALLRLGNEKFAGRFEVGEALDTDLLERAGIVDADAFICCTDDDNTNLVVAQIAQRRFNVKRVVVRVFDPQKAAFYRGKGLKIVCPTLRAISEMVDAVAGHGSSTGAASDEADAAVAEIAEELSAAPSGGEEH